MLCYETRGNFWSLSLKKTNLNSAFDSNGFKTKPNNIITYPGFPGTFSFETLKICS